MARTASDDTTGGAGRWPPRSAPRPGPGRIPYVVHCGADPLQALQRRPGQRQVHEHGGDPVAQLTLVLRCARTPAPGATARSGASSPRKRESIRATAVSSTSFTVAPVARRTALTSSRASSEPHGEDTVPPDGGVQARGGRLGADAGGFAHHAGRAAGLARVGARIDRARHGLAGQRAGQGQLGPRPAGPGPPGGRPPRLRGLGRGRLDVQALGGGVQDHRAHVHGGQSVDQGVVRLGRPARCVPRPAPRPRSSATGAGSGPAARTGCC